MGSELKSEIWEQALEDLRCQVDEENFNTWIKTARYRGSEDGTVHLDVPSAFNQAWLTRNYQEQIVDTLGRIAERKVDVTFHVSPLMDEMASESEASARRLPQTPSVTQASVIESVDCLESAGLSSALTFEQFVVGESNRFAHAACRAVAEPDTEAWNPLLVWGGVGLGKTHLLHATGQAFLKHAPKARVRYVNSERFMNGFIQAIQQGNISQFRETYRSVDLLLLDDVQFLFGKEGTQNEFFHTFNELHGHHKKIVLSCDRPPSEMSNIEERLRSRFEWGLIVDVQAPDLETRVAILRQKADVHGFALSNEVAIFIAERIKTNIRKLEGVLTSLRHYWYQTRKPITLESVQQVLGHYVIGEEPLRVTVERIQESVCDFFNITRQDLNGHGRHKKVTLPRHLAMYLCRLLTDLSYPEIAVHFNGRNHTSVLHAYKKIQTDLLRQSELQDVTNYLAKKIQESAK